MTPATARLILAALVASVGVAAPPGAAAQAGADSARRQAPNPADVHFMTAMISHHAQAIVMGRMAPTNGASDAVQRLAARIINAQQDEIAIMQQWLRDRGQPAPQVDSAGLVVGQAAGHHHLGMPGMLTDAELKQLGEARGKEFDRLFLTLMIRHHQGAVAMVKELNDSTGAALDDTVFKIASDIHADQTTEISRMQTMLFNLLLERASQ